MKFRKRPVVIEAIQLPTHDQPEEYTDGLIAVFNWCKQSGFVGEFDRSSGQLKIATLEGEMLAGPGDWIIKGIKGEFYPCRADIFDATYEPVGEYEA